MDNSLIPTRSPGFSSFSGDRTTKFSMLNQAVLTSQPSSISLAFFSNHGEHRKRSEGALRGGPSGNTMEAWARNVGYSSQRCHSQIALQSLPMSRLGACSIISSVVSLMGLENLTSPTPPLRARTRQASVCLSVHLSSEAHPLGWERRRFGANRGKQRGASNVVKGPLTASGTLSQSERRNHEAVVASADAGRDGPRSENMEPNWSKVKTKKELLLEYVHAVQPEFIDRFFKKADDQVVDAMRQTVSNMLGTLPPQFFEVTISTVGENLAQLMFRVMMTGYMFRNAQYRMELANMVGSSSAWCGTTTSALPGGNGHVDGSQNLLPPSRYADGVQTSHVSGEVLRWNRDAEAVERMGAQEYIAMLEGEVRKLKGQLETERGTVEGVAEGHHLGSHANELLEYLKRLEPKNLETLTSSAEGDALEAMNVFIKRLLGVPDLHEIKTLKSRTTVAEMARLLYWLMIVGYSLRSLEVRFDMEQALLGAPTSPKSLPPTDPMGFDV